MAIPTRVREPHSLIHPPVVFNQFDWVVWLHDFEDIGHYIVFGNINGTLNNARTVLVHPEPAALRQLSHILWGKNRRKRTWTADG